MRLTDGERDILREQEQDAMPIPVRSAEQVADVLWKLVEWDADEVEGFEGASCETYEELGVLTRDAGFVLSVNGREFQITVVQSR